MSLDDKFRESIELLRKGENLALALNPNDGYWLAFSGGKDSQVLLLLAQLAGVKFKAHYNVTGNDPIENVYFLRKHYPFVVWEHPKEKFFKLVEKKGLPTIPKRFCCERIKESTGAGNVVLTGVRAEESRKRAAYAAVEVYSRRKEHQGKARVRSLDEIEENEHQCIKGKDRVMVRPLLRWTEAEIWEAIREYNLPVNPCYQIHGRVGCIFCPFSSRKQMEDYEQRYPKMLDALLKHLEVYWKRSPEHMLPSPAAYYAWWKSKATVTAFMKDPKMARYLESEVLKAAGRGR